MLPSTLDIVRTALKGDPSVTAAERGRIVAMLRSGCNTATITSQNSPVPTVIRRGELATRMGRSTRFIDRLAQAGVLRKVRLPGRARAVGFLASEVTALLS